MRAWASATTAGVLDKLRRTDRGSHSTDTPKKSVSVDTFYYESYFEKNNNKKRPVGKNKKNSAKDTKRQIRINARECVCPTFHAANAKTARARANGALRSFPPQGRPPGEAMTCSAEIAKQGKKERKK